MNVKVLRGDTGVVVGHYAASGDSITSQEAREVVTSARGGRLLGVFDQGKVVGLVAVDTNDGSIRGATSLPGVDISEPIGRIVEHYSPASPSTADAPNYRATGDPWPEAGPAYMDYGTPQEGYEDDGYGDGYGYDEPDPNNDGSWNHETRDNSDFINGWGADEATGVTDPSSSGQIRWPDGMAPESEPIATMPGDGTGGYAQPSLEKRRSPVAGIILGVLAFALVAGGVAVFLSGAWQPIAKSIGIMDGNGGKGGDKNGQKSDDPVSIVVPDGYGSGQIAELLVDGGIIDDAGDFHKEVVRQGAESSLKSGSYVFRPSTSLTEIVETLVSGPNDSSSRVTIPEGLSVAKTAEAIEAALGIPASEFMEQAKASKYVADYPFLDGVGEDSLEGFLFPKTYDFSGKEPNADMVIRRMLDQFKAEVDLDTMDAKKDELNAKYNLSLSRYDIIKMASIIEREATNDDDRPKIASVFYNRLGRECPGLGYVRPYLESDATMAYVLGREVTPEDLKQESPYNTYLTEGLPPTPICSPSMQSIEAAKNPADTNDFYFFIVEKDGYSNHSFSEGYDQHQEVIANAQREMQEKGIS